MKTKKPSQFQTTREFLVWAQDRKETLKAMQDIALDNYKNNKTELGDWLSTTIQTMNELDIFIKDCENILFKYIMSTNNDTPTTSSISKEQRVYELVEILEIAKKRKKEVMKAYNDEIKRIQGEIKDIIDNEEEEEND
jgi:predicted  nucleic acid-binding Zn-ribbon protein